MSKEAVFGSIVGTIVSLCMYMVVNQGGDRGV